MAFCSRLIRLLTYVNCFVQLDNWTLHISQSFRTFGQFLFYLLLLKALRQAQDRRWGIFSSSLRGTKQSGWEARQKRYFSAREKGLEKVLAKMVLLWSFL
jgi:hypothetical protein